MRLAGLYATSMLCGFCMMALELLGGRLLYPTFGSSIDVWAAVISVFVFSLALGYAAGGRLADRARSSAPLGLAILAAAAFFCALPVYAPGLTAAINAGIASARWGVLTAALLLYLPPSLLLGAVSPLLVKLVFGGPRRVGRSTGSIYAIGSMGSVLGVLVSDYFLLVRFTLDQSVIAMGLALAALGAVHLLLPVQIADEALPGRPA